MKPRHLWDVGIALRLGDPNLEAEIGGALPIGFARIDRSVAVTVFKIIRQAVVIGVPGTAIAERSEASNFIGGQRAVVDPHLVQDAGIMIVPATISKSHRVGCGRSRYVSCARTVQRAVDVEVSVRAPDNGRDVIPSADRKGGGGPQVDAVATHIQLLE